MEFRQKTDKVGTIYDRIVALSDEGVWVPAVGNGALRNLLEEMAQRGWRVIPPDGDTAESLLTRLVSEAGIPQFGVNQDIPQSFLVAWSEAKKFLSEK